MKKINHYIEQQLTNLGSLIIRKKYLFLFVIGLITTLIIINIQKIQIDTSTEGFLRKKDPVRIVYDQFRDQFGRDERIIVAVQTSNIFNLKTLVKLRKLHYDLKNNVPYLNDINSLINARNSRGEKNSLIVEDLFTQWPKNESELKKIRQIALTNPLYQNLILNKEATFTVIILKSNTYTSEGKEDDDLLSGFDDNSITNSSKENAAYLSDAENSAMVAKVRSIVQNYQSNDFKIVVVGSPTITNDLKHSMKTDMAKFNLLVLSVIIIFLILLFRRISGIILPFITVIISVLSTMGLMALTNTPIMLPTQIIPSFLLAVGVGASVHLLTIFYKHYDQSGNRLEAIIYALQNSSLAIIMTSLTTAAGLISFATSKIAPIADLGIFAALGVILSLIYTIILLPTLLAILPIKSKPITHTKHDRIQHILNRIASISQKYAKSIIIVSILLIIISGLIALKLKYSHNVLEWFAADSEIRQATTLIDHQMKGTVTLEILLDTKKENGLYDYELLQTIKKFKNYSEKIKSPDYFVGKVLTLVDVIEELHQALNENSPEYHQIPKDQKLIAQEILLFENSGSDDLQDFVDSKFSKARITLKVPWIDAIKYQFLLDDLHNYMQKHFPSNIKITVTGLITLLSRTVSAAIHSTGVSYLIALLIISCMMMFLLNSIKLGLISMLPNLLPIFIVLAIMGLFNLSLDMFTMLIGSIIIGIAVDDTVHFMYHFQKYYQKTNNVDFAIRETLSGTGRAMLVTSIVLGFGFFVYLFASMKNLINFGLLSGIAIIIALISDFFLAPALMKQLYQTKQE